MSKTETSVKTGKRKISYQWRLFLPLVIILWTLLLGIAAWEYYREISYREKFVSQQLKMVNSRVIKSLIERDWQTIEKFKGFMEEFYDVDPVFDEVRMTIYDSDWQVVESLGEPIALTDEEKENPSFEMFERESITEGDTPSAFAGRNFYMINSTPQGRYFIVSALPHDEKVQQYLTGDTNEIWIVVFILALVATIMTFITSKHLSRNIYLLHQFADRSAHDPWFVPGNEFAHDELGDIARQIVHLYNERAQARERTAREHQMNIHTIEEKARQKRQLTSNINHELKTPIGVIKGYLDTILESPEMDADTRTHFIKKARDHANRLASLIADVSAIMRLEEGENQINTEALNMHELAYMFANDAHESGILGHFNLKVDIPLETIIKGNTNLINGVLLNLTKNAVNYSGGDEIVLKYKNEDDSLYTFVFYDNGNGVPEAAIEHLFDRFYRIDSGRTRRAGGTGLGLAIVYNTIKVHGGTIVARNRPQGGLEFEFTLPKDIQ